MPEIGWSELILAAFGGGFAVKFIEIAYQEIRDRKDHKKLAEQDKKLAEQFVDAHLDPLLKAADELVGKLRSLAENDYKKIYSLIGTPELTQDFNSLLYLIATFWARIEIIRTEGLSVSMGQDSRGKQLLNFLDCIESRRIRIVDRASQRAIGEIMVETQCDKLKTKSFISFIKALEEDETTQRWLTPLIEILFRTRHTHERQQLLQYGVIVHAFIDTLDPKHLVTRDRPSYPNKLTKKSWRGLKYRVFGQYLTFVKEKEKYIGLPR
jgi:hypothetical protein